MTEFRSVWNLNAIQSSCLSYSSRILKDFVYVYEVSTVLLRSHVLFSGTAAVDAASSPLLETFPVLPLLNATCKLKLVAQSVWSHSPSEGKKSVDFPSKSRVPESSTKL